MITKFNRSDVGNENFDNFIDDYHAYSHDEHRRGSNFYTKAIVLINEEFFPQFPEYWGYWETNMFIRDTEYGWERDEIYELTRVEMQTIMVPKNVWVAVKSE